MPGHEQKRATVFAAKKTAGSRRKHGDQCFSQDSAFSVACVSLAA